MAKKAAPRRKSRAKSTRSRRSESASQPAEQKTEGRRSGFALQDDRVEDALISGEHRDLLEDYFGEDLYEELRGLATRSRRAQVRGGPRVLVLPGIMGSKLGTRGRIFDDTIWVDPVDMIAGRLADLTLKADNEGIEPLGVLLTTYLKLKLTLRLAGFDADFHPYDWRRSIRDLGAELATRIVKATGSSDAIVPLYLVAHSMGGLVSRAALKVLDDGKRVTRLVMLGTPNYGSFSPVQALSGYHSMVRKVAALDLKHDEKQLVNNVFSTFTGLYQMLPEPTRFTGMDLYRLENWPPTGMAPRKAILEAAPKIHEHLAPNDERFVLIAGINKETVVGVHRTSDSFVFTQSLEGDGTVPLAFAQLDGVKTYYIEEQHGSLANNGDVAEAVIDILESGSTDVLKTTWTPKRRGVSWEVTGARLAPVPFDERTGKDVSRHEVRHLLDEFAAPALVTREAIPAAPVAEISALSQEPIVVGRKRQRRIDLRLARGDITQVDTRAIVIGLFAGVKPAGAASAIDEQLDGAISDFTERRMLSANVGEVFIMPANRYRTGADMVVFAGLGSYDDFSEEVLRVVGENVARALVRTKVDEFATVMVGSGSGLELEDVLKNLIQGFIRGVRDADERGWLRAVTFCERDQKRFEQMHREVLRLSASSLFDETEVTVDAFELPPAPPPSPTARRIARGPTPAYLIVREIPGRTGQPTDATMSASFALRASVLTAGSKATVVTDSVDVDAAKLNRHLEKIETQAFGFGGLAEFGSDLGDMVLPSLVRQALSAMRDYHLVVINDVRTSRIPWETIHIDGKFPTAGAGMSRKYEAENLTVAKWLEERRLDRELTVLLIVNPTEDLAGAEEEGRRIKAILGQQPNVQLDELWRNQATLSAIRAAFRSGKYDVVHYAGHAFFDPLNRARSGIVCHGHRVLSGADLAGLERLPALMFFNACESGRVRGAPPRVRSSRDRGRGEGTATRLQTTVGFAEALLRAGVGNYIGTYWPVGDAPAKTFGETFYQQIVDGASLGAAIGAARGEVRSLQSEDWADYILYGSPEFVVKYT
jgi:pimeloyl-ACP methyl ester carboxylesterase